jgi:hypothetical protein
MTVPANASDLDPSLNTHGGITYDTIDDMDADFVPQRSMMIIGILIALIVLLCLILGLVIIPPLLATLQRKLPVSKKRISRRYATIDGWLITKVRPSILMTAIGIYIYMNIYYIYTYICGVVLCVWNPLVRIGWLTKCSFLILYSTLLLESSRPRCHLRLRPGILLQRERGSDYYYYYYYE